MDYKDCRQLGTVTPTENKKKFTINNPNKRDVYRVKVDGCLITEGRKCDYLFEVDNPISMVFYVELKGDDVKHAYEQIIATIEFCENKHRTTIRKCHIVHSSSPKISPTAQVLKKRLKDKYDIISLTHSNQGNVTI
jgi:hypothetical protein